MVTSGKFLFAITMLCVLAGLFLYWRYFWFFRNPERNIPSTECIVSPADGTVVYAKILGPNEDAISVKQGIALKIKDIAKNEVERSKVLIGIFMSPFDVHYNRAPIQSTVQSIQHFPPIGSNLSMFFMHTRILLGLPPYESGSMHILQNERMVTHFTAEFKKRKIDCRVVQIAAMNVNGIDSYIKVGQTVTKGSIFGMIRIGSQVDLLITKLDDMTLQVKPGQTVKAGETVLID